MTERINNEFLEIRKTIELNNSIAISGHINPDGDAVGACAALAISLKLLGKDVCVIMEDYPDNFRTIPTQGLFVTQVASDYIPDLYIVLDCGDKERLGKNANLFDKALHTLNIDHHISNTYFTKENYVDTEASSASEIVFQLLYGYAPIDADIAAAIYAGIVFDTGGFRHSSTTPITMAIVSALMEYDFSFTEIYNSIFHSRSISEAKLLGIALSNLKEYFGGRCVATCVTKKDLEKIGAQGDGFSEISSYMKGIWGVVVVIVVHEKSDGLYKVSMRSDNPINVSEVAMTFGGGGHKLASGCVIEGNADEVIEKILREIEKQL